MSIPQIEQEVSPNGSDPAAPEAQIIEQPRRARETWLNGPTDLVEMDLEVPALNDSVTIRSLSAGQFSEILNRSQVATPSGGTEIDIQILQRLTFMYGMVEPKFSEEETNVIAFRLGPAFTFVVEAINEISKSSPEAIARFRKRFRAR